jgi:choline kinase
MTAVILAAGRGGRLRGIAGTRPKCLMRIGESTLLERQIRSLRAAGVGRIVVVTGYRDEEVRRVAGAGVDIVHNVRFASTNSLYSLWLSRDCLLGGCTILNGDVLFHDQLLRDLLTARYEDALLVSARGAAFTDEEMKVCVRGGRVVDVAKTLSDDTADAENVGIAKFGADGSRLLVEELNAIVASGAVKVWAPAAFAAFSRRRPLYAVESRGFPWIEIDFPEDYWRACSEVAAAIDAREPRPHAAVPLASGAGRTRHHV